MTEQAGEDVPFIAVGRITRAHGIKGEVAVLPLSQVESRFDPGSKLILEGHDRTLSVASSKPHRQRLLVRFDGVVDRDAAEALQGRYLFVASSEVPPLPDDEFWPHQLLGCEIVTESGRRLGGIKEIVHTPANDVWVADGPDGEVLVPALKDVVARVDLDGRRVVVREIAGLTSP